MRRSSGNGARPQSHFSHMLRPGSLQLNIGDRVSSLGHLTALSVSAGSTLLTSLVRCLALAAPPSAMAGEAHLPRTHVTGVCNPVALDGRILLLTFPYGLWLVASRYLHSPKPFRKASGWRPEHPHKSEMLAMQRSYCDPPPHPARQAKP